MRKPLGIFLGCVVLPGCVADHGETADETPPAPSAALAVASDRSSDTPLPGPVGVASRQAEVASADADQEVIDEEVDVEEADLYALARDVDLALIRLPADLPAPVQYHYPQATGFQLSGTEFWQRWAGGYNPTYHFADGTEAGRRCMQASAIRFEAILTDPPPALVTLRDTTNWGGAFFNWNDDFTRAVNRDGSNPTLWAWRTTLIKWMSQTNRDGSCYLPTRELVERAANACLAAAEANGSGEIEGCYAE
jgi:hypothetical protein